MTDMKQEGERKFDKVVRKIILKIGDSTDWENWFGQINEKKATYTFSMQSGRAQKSLFSLMDKSTAAKLNHLPKFGRTYEGIWNKIINLKKK